MLNVTIGRLLGAITRSVEAQFKIKLAHFNVNYSYLHYLLVISAHDGINQNELAKRVDVGKGSVSKAVKYLLKNELILRQHDFTDTRIKNVYITPKGKEIADQFKEVFLELNAKITDGFPEQELLILKIMLERIYKNVAIDENNFILADLNFLDK